MKLTIAMSNRNRDWFLDRSIFLLSKQTLPQNEWELIIVDDGSTDQSEDVILRYKKMNIIKNFHYIKNTKKRYDPPGSPARTCNIATKASHGDYILYTDPEIMPLPDLAEKHYLSHEGKIDRYVHGLSLNTREFHIISGDGIEYCRGAFLGNAYTDYDWYNIENVWKIMNEKIKKIQTDFNLSDSVTHKEFFKNNWQAGLSLSRKLMFDLRGFEEDFCDRNLGLSDKFGGDDILFMEYLRRLKISGHVNSNINSIHIYHPKPSTYGSFAHNYATEYLKKHPDQKCCNINREWGLIEENGFVKVF